MYVYWRDVAYALSLAAVARMANRYRDSCNCRIYLEFVPQRCCCIVVATAMLAEAATKMIALFAAAAIVQATVNTVATAQFVNMAATVNTAVVMVGV